MYEAVVCRICLEGPCRYWIECLRVFKVGTWFIISAQRGSHIISSGLYMS